MIIHHDQVGCSRDARMVHRSVSVIHPVSQMEDNSYTTISVDTKEAVVKIQHLFYEKCSQQSGYRGNLPHGNKGLYGKPIPNIILSAEKLKAFFLRSGKRQTCPFSPILFNLVLEVLAKRSGKKKTEKRYPN